MEKVDIHLANAEDAPQIHAVAWALSPSNQSSLDGGFLLSGLSLETYETLCEERFVYAARREGAMVGFLSVFPLRHWLAEDSFSLITPFLPPALVPLLRERGKFVGQIGIAPSARRTGIGSLLYARAFAENVSTPLLTTIAEKPYRNEASARFHLKQGFERIAAFRSAEHFGLSDYQSGIYFRGGG